MQDYVTSCERFARAAAELLLQWQGRITIKEKGRADLVTEADLASQSLIQRLIATEFPDHHFVGEEETGFSSAATSSEYCWFVDPLDGTTNYVHGLPGWCVSIALTQRGEPLAGCVFDPIQENCFTASRGEGAFLNGQPIQTSDVESLGNALVAVSLPASVDRESRDVALFLGLLGKIQAFRRLGSAALNLCYVASGRLDAYWAGSVQAWDVAAGVLIVKEAGGVVSSLFGEEFNLEEANLTVAATPAIHRSLIEQLSASNR